MLCKSLTKYTSLSISHICLWLLIILHERPFFNMLFLVNFPHILNVFPNITFDSFLLFPWYILQTGWFDQCNSRLACSHICWPVRANKLCERANDIFWSRSPKRIKNPHENKMQSRFRRKYCGDRLKAKFSFRVFSVLFLELSRLVIQKITLRVQ